MLLKPNILIYFYRTVKLLIIYIIIREAIEMSKNKNYLLNWNLSSIQNSLLNFMRLPPKKMFKEYRNDPDFCSERDAHVLQRKLLTT